MEIKEVQNKKAWLDKLYYNIGHQQYDFELCGTFKKKDGTIGFSKWKKFSKCVFPIDFDGTSNDWKEQKFFEQINQRQILPIEIVLDLEEKKSIPKIIKDLRKVKDKFYVYATGSKGYHVHIFYEKKLSENKKLTIIKYYKADEMKAGPKVLIALEGAKHWKSGKNKSKVFQND